MSEEKTPSKRDEVIAELVSEGNGLRAELTAVYRERSALVAYLAAVFPSVIGTDIAEPGWPVVYVMTPAGQLSWHIAQADRELFTHVPETTNPTWDGHTTEQKYERLAALILAIGEGVMS